MNTLRLAISSGLFSGFLIGKITGKPGAGGGLMGSIVSFIIQLLFLWSGWVDNAPLVLLTVSFFLGIATVEKAENFMLLKWGPRRRHTGKLTSHDYNETNIDEIHGQAIAGLPIFLINHTGSSQIGSLFLSLVLFRLFDTLKPWPVKKAESIKGVWGIMLDDSIAGFMAACLVWVIQLF